MSMFYVCEYVMNIIMLFVLFRRVECYIIVGCESWLWSFGYIYYIYYGYWVLYERRDEIEVFFLVLVKLFVFDIFLYLIFVWI